MNDQIPDDALFQTALKALRKEFFYYSDFMKKTDIEIMRCKKHRTMLTVLSLELLNIFEIKQRVDESFYKNLIIDITTELVSGIREQDSIGIKKPNQFLILLPALHFSKAKILGKELKDRIENIAIDVDIEIKLTSYPQDGTNANEIMQILELGLEKVNDDTYET